MKEDLSVVFKYIRSYYETGFRWLYLFAILIMLGVLIGFNYYGHLPAFSGTKNEWFNNFISAYLLYALPFAAAFFLQALFYRDTAYLKNKWLLLILFFAPAIFAIKTNFTFHHSLLNEFLHGDELVFWLKCSDWFLRSLFVITLIYTLALKNNQTMTYSIKGLTNGKPYLLLVCCMIPVIAIAGSQASFLVTYPRAQMVTQLHLSCKPLRYLVFELSYAFDFLSIEFFFRGFLIFSFIRICGMRCIIPAACFYCCIHFGKPMGEAISSFWGGTLLAIISYHTKNVWGGILVHIGIALLMELTGFIAHTF